MGTILEFTENSLKAIRELQAVNFHFDINMDNIQSRDLVDMVLYSRSNRLKNCLHFNTSFLVKTIDVVLPIVL